MKNLRFHSAFDPERHLHCYRLAIQLSGNAGLIVIKKYPKHIPTDMAYYSYPSADMNKFWVVLKEIQNLREKHTGKKWWE